MKNTSRTIKNIKNIVSKDSGVDSGSIRILIDDNSFCIDVCNVDFNGDTDNDDPLLDQYVLVPISKIQDRTDIIIGNSLQNKK